MSGVPVFKMSPWIIYIIGLMGLSAIFSGIVGLVGTPRITQQTDQLNCLQVKTNSPSCAGADTDVKRNWGMDINYLTGYSFSILIHGIILCGISIYMYLCREPSSV